MSLRQEFVRLAQQEGANLSALCRRYDISRPTAYKWLDRAASGDGALADRSRRPHTSPRRSPPAVEAAVLAVRQAHPAWGGRKVQARLRRQGVTPLPSPSTITAILRRHGQLDPARTTSPGPLTRFEQPAANDLWQLDFKGHVALADGQTRCHPLTVLDDHSRFALGVTACADEQHTTVQPVLTALFQRYGLPRRILCDHGAPWGDAGDQPWTRLGAWLLRVGIRLSHGRPRHPQTQGKLERFHRTLRAEVLTQPPFPSLAAAQTAFDAWRDVYNLDRPHDALGGAVPADRYRPSARPWPDPLPPLDYGPDTLIRRVQHRGEIHFRGQVYLVGKAFRGEPVGLRPTATEGVWTVFYSFQPIVTLDLRSRASPS